MNDIIEAEPRAGTSIATTPELQGGPLAMAMQAMKAGMSIADMRGMLELQKDWEANEARKAYVQAMSEFKRSPPEIFKRKEVAFSGTQYMHATLGDVTQAIMQALAEHGISHRWDTVQSNGQIVVTCILTHKLVTVEATCWMRFFLPLSSGEPSNVVDSLWPSLWVRMQVTTI